MPKPILKWVGGKSKLVPVLKPLLPEGLEEMKYVEPFVGGGALFFHLAPKKACIADLNHDVVNLYRQVRENPYLVIDALYKLEQKKHVDYYVLRTEFNATSPRSLDRAALFMYLNKTCFNGLYRVNRSGQFNVPQGSYKNPTILNREAIFAAAEVLRNDVMIVEGDFEFLLDEEPVDSRTFVYFDPPYAPVSKTSNFTNYTAYGFGSEDQEKLRDLFVFLDKKGAKLMLSNSDCVFIRELYKDFHIETIEAPRAINSKGSKRGKVSEVVVRNYE